jgi:hydrogenase-4 component E
MTFVLIVAFAITLVYLSITERFRSYATLIGIQGLLLFGIALTELHQIELFNLVFVTAETLLFKGIIFPLYLFKIIKRTGISKVHEKAMPIFYSLILVTFGLIFCIFLANTLKNQHIDTIYFAITLFTLFTGIYLIISHKKIFSHLIGFLIIENAVFLMSVAIGSEMPMMINTAILLDVVVSVLMLGVFINRIGDKINDFEVDQLNKLKD